MEQIRNDIDNDKKNLRREADALASCVTPKSSVDLVNTDAFLDKDEVLLAINKSPENTSTYCQGFNYAYSQCNQQCADSCPITKDDLACYGSCANSDPSKKNACLNQCDQSRKCIYNAQFANFGSCMNQCKQTCSSLCQAKYLPCSDEFQTCQATCTNDSSCLQNNIESCLLNPLALGNCQNKPSDQIQICINNSYKCQYGSQQNAGYADCLKNPTIQKNFSASYLYQNPQQQTCSNPFLINPVNNEFCKDDHPETQKCPLSSQCPSCPCGSINQTVTFSYESEIEAPQEVNICEQSPSIPETSCESTGKTIKEFRLVGPECKNMAFNGDPLTFYCRQDWWNEPETYREKNLGAKYDKPLKNITCNRADEVPVGMLVDNSLKWADETIEKMVKISSSIQNLLGYMKKLSEAKDYCACNSKYESGNPVCRACCNYVDPNAEGSSSSYSPGGTQQPYCQFQSCSGNSCQQMINWLYMIINYHREVRISYIDLYINFLSEPRTDILKMLTYARDKVDTFSSLENQKGKQNNVLLSCQQILDNIVYPVTDQNNKISIDQKELYHYCYGQLSGKLLQSSAQYDNWFGCKTTQQVPIEEQREDNEKQKQIYYNLAQ